jgi:hypothetical protein
MFLGRKRLIAGRMPKHDNTRTNDACIIESLLWYFRSVSDAEAQLYFCSGNTTDFALKTPEELVLHPLIKEGLPITKYFTNLQDLVAFYSSNEKVKEPPAAVINEALERSITKHFASSLFMRCCAQECDRPVWLVGPYCCKHFDEHYGSLTDQERVEFGAVLEVVLRTLTYREREIFKLRTGFGDGYRYSRADCARIFKVTTARIRTLEEGFRRKMHLPPRSDQLAAFF